VRRNALVAHLWPRRYQFGTNAHPIL
jgi:hypothetical protein